MTMNRRQLLNTGADSGAGLLAGAALLQSPADAARGRDRHHGGHHGHRPGALFPPLSASEGDLLALPEGFSYEVVAVSGQTDLADGGKTPEGPDGTLVVATHRGYRLVRNHEGSPGSAQPVPLVEGTVYDPGALGGGCTVIETTRTGERLGERVALSGTIGNCAGGPTRGAPGSAARRPRPRPVRTAWRRTTATCSRSSPTAPTSSHRCRSGPGDVPRTGPWSWWDRRHGAQAIARNMIVAERNDDGRSVYSEMTGPCFSPDGKVLFVSVQEPGHVFAITGPWAEYLG